MKVGISLEDENGLYSNICEYFRESSHFFVLDIDKNRIVSSRIVSNHVQYNGKECKVADEILKYRITHLIAGNIGATAQKRFEQASVQVFRYSGNVKDAINNFLISKTRKTQQTRIKQTRIRTH
jgi:predicted Fe-Mo cluster-binding NifX family protein